MKLCGAALSTCAPLKRHDCGQMGGVQRAAHRLVHLRHGGHRSALRHLAHILTVSTGKPKGV